MNLPIPLAVLYAGLGGTVLALIIATAQNRWSGRVFFLLALRLAIGWHFLFEGLYKLNTHLTGPTDANPRTFTSEPYFRAAPGPVGDFMRKQFENPDEIISAKLKPAGKVTPEEFAKFDVNKQAEACPEAVAKELADLLARATAAVKGEAEAEIKSVAGAEERAIKDADATEQRALKGAWTADELEKIRTTANEERRKAHALAEGKRQQIRERVAAYQETNRDLLAAIKAQPDSGALAGQVEAALKTITAKAEDELKAASAAEKKAVGAANATEQKALKAEWTEDERAKIRTKADADRASAKAKTKATTEVANKKIETAEAIAADRVKAARAAYARWVYGVDPRPAKVKHFANDVPLTVPQRLEFLDWLRKEVKAAEWHTNDLGNGYGIDQKRSAELRTDLLNVETDLVRDASSFVADLKKELNGGKAVEEPKVTRRGDTMDKVTMWFLVGVGGCLMAGLFTRLACVMGAGFLVVTYLAHPAFPWYPLPPNTEGNPVFINKNIIECIALLALACMPTGRWLGLDALVLRPFRRYKPEGEPTA